MFFRFFPPGFQLNKTEKASADVHLTYQETNLHLFAEQGTVLVGARRTGTPKTYGAPAIMTIVAYMCYNSISQYLTIPGICRTK